MTTTIHTGDRSTGCDTCTANDYANEIVNEYAGGNWIGAENIPGALMAWVANAPTYYTWKNWQEWISDFDDAYAGEWDSEQDFADHLADETITGDLPEIAQLYFDYFKFARDLFLGDYWSSNGHVFRAN